MLYCNKKLFEPPRGKTNNVLFEQVRHKPTCTSTVLEAGNFGFKQRRNCTIRVAKTKALISFAVTAKMICAFVFAYSNCYPMRRLIFFIVSFEMANFAHYIIFNTHQNYYIFEAKIIKFVLQTKLSGFLRMQYQLTKI